MQDYQHHTPTEDEPWWSVVTPADERRYDRALRLTQFRRDVDSGLSLMMNARKLARRRAVLAQWEAYLDGTVDLFTPRPHRAPSQDGARVYPRNTGKYSARPTSAAGYVCPPVTSL